MKVKIRWLGQACFLIEADGVTLVTDPFDESIGLPPPSVEADIVTVSHDHFDHNAVHVVRGKPTVVKGTGETQVGAITLTGIATFHDAAGGSRRGPNTVFVIEAEGLRLCHCGDLGHALEARHIQAIGQVDVLLVPVGGTYTLDARGAESVASALSPRITIPMHYRIEGLTLGVADAGDFLSGKSHRELTVLDVTPATVADNEGIVVLAPPTG